MDKEDIKIFVTDYASYNNGSQFEFGHWVCLDDHLDAADLMEYITNHFKECDKESPLDSPREELMITDYEGFPSQLYSESGMDFDKIYEWMELDDEDMAKVAFILDQNGRDIEYALSHYENVHMTEYVGNETKWDLFEIWHPELEEMANNNSYVTIDYDRFVSDNYTEFEYDGTDYLVDDNWNY